MTFESDGSSDRVMPKSTKLERVINAGTDGAIFFLFHPDDLAHHNQSDLGWFNDDCAPELSAGKLIAFMTGGDGGFSFRITENGVLTQLEKKHHVCSWDFGLAVSHNRVFLDGGDNLPSLEQVDDPLDEDCDEIDKDCWIEIANGNYKVTVHAVNCWTEPDYKPIKGLTSYIIHFQPVTDFKDIKPAKGPVKLFHDKGWKPMV